MGQINQFPGLQDTAEVSRNSPPDFPQWLLNSCINPCRVWGGGRGGGREGERKGWREREREGWREGERDLHFSLFWSGQSGTYFGNGDRGALYMLGQGLYS